MEKKIIFICLMLLFPLSVYADNINLNCPGEVKPNTEFTCEVTGDSSSNIGSLSAVVSTSDGLTFLSFIPAARWQGDGADGEITLYTDKDFTGQFNIGTLKFKATSVGNNSITVSQGFFYESRKQITLSPTSSSIKVIAPETPGNDEKPGTNSGNNAGNSSSSNTDNDNNNNDDNNGTTVVSSNYLIDIVVENYSLYFDKETLAYDLTIGDEKTLNIEPILEDNSSSVAIVGNENLKDGSVISIAVTDTNNETRTYKINIKKEIKQEKKDYSLIFAIIIGVLVIVNIIRIIANRNKKKVNGGS